MLKKISRYWWCQILGWGFYFLLNIFTAFTYSRLNMDWAYRTIIAVVMGILATHALRYIIIRFKWFQYNANQLIFLFFAGVICTGVVINFGSRYIYDLLHLSSHRKENAQMVLSRLIGAFFLTSTWLLIYIVWHYVEKNRNDQMDKLRLESVLKGLELKTIKSQLNPHFIFNALNSIRALIDENPQRARRAITELSNILRSSMQAEKMETVTLENEVNIVKDYLALENIRFEERLKVVYDIDPDTLELPIPPMMLQTLVENAIKHGISKEINGGVVSIASHLHDKMHEITIRNTGHLNGHVNENGFGLQSTRQRLNLLFGGRARFEIYNSGNNLVEARIALPVTDS